MIIVVIFIAKQKQWSVWSHQIIYAIHASVWISYHGLYRINRFFCRRWKHCPVILRAFVETERPLKLFSTLLTPEYKVKFDEFWGISDLLFSVVLQRKCYFEVNFIQIKLFIEIVNAFSFYFWDLWILLAHQKVPLKRSIGCHQESKQDCDDSTQHCVDLRLAMKVEWRNWPRKEVSLLDCGQ